ncbi:unnamed protein product, partial [Closterium sp. NIES-53]
MADALASSQPFIAISSSSKSSSDPGLSRTNLEPKPEVRAEPQVTPLVRTSDQQGRTDGHKGLLSLVSRELDFVADVTHAQRQRRALRGRVKDDEASPQLPGSVPGSSCTTMKSSIAASTPRRCPQAYPRYKQAYYRESSVAGVAAAEKETKGKKGYGRGEQHGGAGLAVDDYERELRMLRSQVRAMTGAVNGKALLLAEARVRQLIQARKQREAAWFVFTWRRSHLRLSNATWPPSNRWAAELAAANEMPPRTPFHIAAKSKSIRTRSARGKQRKASKAVMGGDDVSAVGSDDVAAEGNGDVAAVGDDDIVIVLLVHNRPAYLNRTLDALSKVDGIQHALLIVSHDGFYPPMHALVQSISFCRVKQLYFPFSPHLFNGSFPAASADDCRGKSRRPWETKAGGAERWEKWQRKWPRQVLCEEGTAKGGAGGLGLGHGVRDGVSEEERLGEEERVGER